MLEDLFNIPNAILLKTFIAGVLASLACGLGALPLLIKRFNFIKNNGIGYAGAGGLMISASVFNLIIPGIDFKLDTALFNPIIAVIIGLFLGSYFLTLVDKVITKLETKKSNFKNWGGKTGILIFIAMSFHSLPEGIAVGVGYTSEEVFSNANFGNKLALAIGLHNIPEGLAVAIPLRAAGASITKCFWSAVLTSLPQPIAAIPASYASWIFKPLMPYFMGFAAGAMIFLVIQELIPSALKSETPQRVAWAFMFGFSLMLLIQVLL